MKVIDLLNKIANKEIKRGTIIKFEEMEFFYDYPNLAGIYRVGMNSSAQNNLFYFLDSTSLDYEIELIEENQDIDIQSIEEFNSEYTMNNVEFQLQDKINQMLFAIKQLDRQINNN